MERLCFTLGGRSNRVGIGGAFFAWTHEGGSAFAGELSLPLIILRLGWTLDLRSCCLVGDYDTHEKQKTAVFYFTYLITY